MENNYLIRRAQNTNDIKELKELFNKVFYPEKVGDLAEIFSDYLPEMELDNWFLAEEKQSSKIVAAFALIPWVWEIQDIKLKVAEMGIVATAENHQGKGLMKMLNKEFDNTLACEEFDLAVIQGIPGFYHKFGYNYAIPMENHINLDLNTIHDSFDSSSFEVRKAEITDIPFLMQEDENHKKSNLISVVRSHKQWEYILTHGGRTEYGCEILIFESINEKFYCRVLLEGFGKGLIISEVSGLISDEAVMFMFYLLKERVLRERKPFIRLNVDNDSHIGKYAISLGAEKSKSYAWQIKVPNKLGFLVKIKSVLQERVLRSDFVHFSDTLRLDFFTDAIDLLFENGTIVSIQEASESEVENTFCIPKDLFASLILGHRSWEQLQFARPDIAPIALYLNPDLKQSENKTGKLINILFPQEKSWINLQY